MRNLYLSALTILLVLLVLNSCFVLDGGGTDKNNRAELDGIASTLEADPQAAYGRLENLSVATLSDGDYHYYILLLAKALDHKGVNISSFEGKVLEAKAYFSKQNAPAKAALACFELARVYEAQGNQAKTLYFYQEANRWAVKADYAVPSLTYAKIPYNIALKLFYYERYDEAIGYLNTAIADKNCPLLRKQHMIELKGIFYDNLHNLDSALYCYHSATSLAEQNGDKEGKRRIAYNSCMSFIYAKDYQKAEEKCNELLPQFMAEQDSLRMGSLYMVLARVAYEKGNAAQAVGNMLKSERFLATANDAKLRLDVLEMFVKAYSLSGSADKLRLYKQQQSALKAELEKAHAAELEELQAQVEQSKQQGENAVLLLQAKEGFRSGIKSKNLVITLLVWAIVAVALTAFFIIYRHGRGMYKELRVVCEEDVKLELSRRELFNEMLVNVFDNPNIDRMYKLELMDRVEQAGRHIPTVMRYRYKELRNRLKKEYPDFTPDELTLCWYIFTATVPEEDIPAALGLSFEDFNRIKLSMLDKMEKAGKPFAQYYQRLGDKSSKLS